MTWETHFRIRESRLGSCRRIHGNSARYVQWLADDGGSGNPAGEWGQVAFLHRAAAHIRKFSRDEPLNPER